MSYITSMAQWSTKINQVIFAVLDVSWTMGLNGDKTSELFCINICCFSTRFYIFLYYSGTLIQVSSKLWMFLISTPHKTRTFTVGVNSNDHIPRKRFCSRGVAWTWPPKSLTNRSHRKRSYSISNIGNMMRCNHLSCVPVGPFAGELWHFEYSPTTTVHHSEF